MSPALAPALLTFCAAVVMAYYVLVRRHKDAFHWMLSGFLVGLVLWTGGVLARVFSVEEVQLAVSVRVIFVGILLASSFWLLTAFAYAEERGGELRARASLVVFPVIALFAMALFTNDAHRLFLRRVDLASISEGPSAYVGPVFWAMLVWAYGCVGTGVFLYLRAARRMVRTDSRRRGWMLAFVSVLPVASSTIYVFQILPVPYDLTPMGLVVAIGLIWLAVFRYRLFESVPLAREEVLAHLEDGVVMASSSGRITRWNPAAGRLFEATGIHRGEPLADALARLLPSFGEEAGPPDAVSAPLLRTTDGRLVEVTTAEVDAEHGEAAGQFAILSDRSEAERVEKIARRTQRLEIVGALAAEVAREISEPLRLAHANLVEIEELGGLAASPRDARDEKLAEELLDLRAVASETLEGVERMLRIVDGMRELSTVEQDGFTEVDLADVARDALRLARLDDIDPAARVELVLEPVPLVPGNADRLVQVVLNLLVNARHALRGVADPGIAIHTRVVDDHVELTVRDNGPGIPDELRDRVFDPFFTTRGPDEGTGLGLAIAFDIAREHGGMLEERPGAGGGACFALRIPVGAAARWAGSGRKVQLRRGDR